MAQRRKQSSFWCFSDDIEAPCSYQGEIDIVEGVNDQSPNAATLHTNEGPLPKLRYGSAPTDKRIYCLGCTMPASRLQTGYDSGCFVALL